MTPPIDDPRTLRRILANTDALLLDFDGPICSVFAGFPAPDVAQQLRDILAEGGHTHLPDEVQAATDPFDVLFYAATLGEDEARYVEAAFTAHEVEAIHTAQPTPGAHNLIHAWKATGRPLAIVSNNSSHAVHSYLDLHGVRPDVDHVACRTSADTSLLKPSSYLIRQVVDRLETGHSQCTLVGDSATDIRAAHDANIGIIGFCNKPGKLRTLSDAQVIVTEIATLQRVLPTS